MWQRVIIQDDKGKVIETDHRTYTNSTTGSTCMTTKVYTDKEGNDWFAFDDLFTIPYTRSFAAAKISSLYALGLTKDDLTNHIGSMKQILRSTDADKYEKAYAQILDFESKATNATDPVKQMSSLVCVYFMLADELIDSFTNDIQMRKMSLLEADPTMHGFFLTRQIDLIERYSQGLGALSAIALLPQNGSQDHLV